MSSLSHDLITFVVSEHVESVSSVLYCWWEILEAGRSPYHRIITWRSLQYRHMITKDVNPALNLRDAFSFLPIPVPSFLHLNSCRGQCKDYNWTFLSTAAITALFFVEWKFKKRLHSNSLVVPSCQTHRTNTTLTTSPLWRHSRNRESYSVISITKLKLMTAGICTNTQIETICHRWAVVCLVCTKWLNFFNDNQIWQARCLARLAIYNTSLDRHF